MYVDFQKGVIMGLSVSNSNSNSLSAIQNKLDKNAEGSVTSQVQSPISVSPEMVSKEYGNASKAVAMAQIMIGEKITNKTTPEEYIAKLIKQGKQIDKDFKVDNDSEHSTFIDILSPKGQIVKSLQFSKFNYGADSSPKYSVSVRYINPNSNEAYKRVYLDWDGEVVLDNNDPLTGDMVSSERFDKDAKTTECSSVTNESGCKITKNFNVEENS